VRDDVTAQAARCSPARYIGTVSSGAVRWGFSRSYSPASGTRGPADIAASQSAEWWMKLWQEDCIMSRLLRMFEVRESGNKQFWLSHAVILLSTVLGVYLAAQAGYRTALDFEVTRAQRDSYFMRVALLDELNDNIEFAEKFAAVFVGKNGASWAESLEDFKLQSFVWDTMKQQNTTFQIPAGILSAIRRFNDNVEGSVREIRKISRVTLTDGTQTISFFGHLGEKMVAPAQAIQDAAKKMKTITAPALERNIASLRADLEAKRVPLDQ
jgi:hypothetical protein